MKKMITYILVLLIMAGCLANFNTENVKAATSSSTMKLNASRKVLKVGKTYKLKVYNCKKKIKWSSSDRDYVTVSSKGVVKAKREGEATITAKIGTKKLKCKIQVIGKLDYSTKARVCESVATHYNIINNVDYFVVFVGECTETEEGFEAILRSQGGTQANILVAGVSVNLTTGEVTDDLGHSWNLNEE